MKKILLLSSLILFLATLLSSFLSEKDPVASPVEEIHRNYLNDLQVFASAASRLYSISQQLDDSPASQDLLRKTLSQTRQAYKKTEYLAAHLDPFFNKKHLNGAPLLSLEPNAPQLVVVEPEGLQVLEELVFGEDLLASKEDIMLLSEKLAKKAEEFLHFQQRVHLTDRLFFEATRFQMVRLFTLGLTGFDSPAALASLPESYTALQSVQEDFQLYKVLLEAEDQSLYQEINQHFDEALAYLANHRDFDNFDRLHFLRSFINPLFSMLLDAQLVLHVETYYESLPLNQKYSVNYLSRNLFDEDFLNPYYYTRLSKEQDNEALLALGRSLFFDPVLSASNERSCASCHHPEKAFTDGFPKSIATDFKGTVDRNAPTLLNAAYADRYFYDLRSYNLEDQIDHVISDHREFGTSYLDIFEKLEQSDEYVKMFEQAFPDAGTQAINKNSLSSALAAYVVSLQSMNSTFDQYVRGESKEIDPLVRDGFNLFMGKAACGTCHFAPVFNGLVPPLFHESESEVLGVPATTDTLRPELDADPGRFAGVLKEEAMFYQHSFKTTTVRNAALTAPYMHNGVYQSLEEVVEFYDRGGGQGLGLDVPYQTLAPDPLHLSDYEKRSLVAFMEALSDTTGLKSAPLKLPDFGPESAFNGRKVGGNY
jgi:cytochrome c peroxidase